MNENFKEGRKGGGRSTVGCSKKGPHFREPANFWTMAWLLVSKGISLSPTGKRGENYPLYC